MANAPPFAVDDGVFCDFPQKQKRHVAQPTRECLGPGAVVIEEGRAMSRRAAGGAAPGGAPYPNASHANLVGTFVEDDRWATSYQSQCAGEAERSERRRLRKAVVPAFEHNGAAARESQVEAYSAGPTGSGFFGSRPVDMRFETKDLQAGTSVSEEASHVPGYMGHVPKRPADIAGKAFLGQGVGRPIARDLLVENHRTKPAGYTGHMR